MRPGPHPAAAAALFMAASAVHAFVPSGSVGRVRPRTRAFLPALSAEGGDDFWSEYDPGQFTDVDRFDDPPPQRDARRGPPARGNFDEDTGHDYARDPTDSGEPVDAAAIDSLLSERVRCKKKKMFEEADLIRDELRRDFGVTVWDKDRLWRTGTDPPGRGPRRDAPRGRDRRERPPKEFVERDFGPDGHDYRRVGGEIVATCALTVAELHAELAERLQAKLARDFTTSDGIQQKLWLQGVRIHDGKKEWRCDGQSFGEGREYGKSLLSEPVTAEREAEIAALVDKRNCAKGGKQYEIADDVRAQLETDYEVILNDRNKEWSVGGKFPRGNGGRGEYSLAGEAPDFTDEDFDVVEDALRQRQGAKKNRDYRAADLIREELENVYNVKVDDKAKQWRVMHASRKRRDDDVRAGGGWDEFDKGPTQKDDTLTPADDTLTPADDGDAAGLAWDPSLGKLVQMDAPPPPQEPAPVPPKKNFAPSSGATVYTRSDNSGRLPRESPGVLAHVEARIEERRQEILAMDYATGEKIRGELRDEFHVEIDDRNWEWRAAGTDGFTATKAAGVAAAAAGDQLYARVGGGELDPDDDVYVASRVERLRGAVADLDYDTVFAVRTELQALYGVEVDSDAGTWSVTDGNYAVEAGAPSSVGGSPLAAAKKARAWASVGGGGDLVTLNSKTIPQLKDLLREKGLKLGGRKAELVARLFENQ